MSKTILTYIYGDFENEISSTYQFRRSVDHFGYSLINVLKGGKFFASHDQVIKLLTQAVAELPADMPTMYADGADTFFLRDVNIPTDKILYSTELAYYPTVPGIERYEPIRRTPWCYLNGGAYCGPAGLLHEWYTRYLLPASGPDVNGQAAQHDALFAALADGFPIDLDQECREMQSIAFDMEFQENGSSENFGIYTLGFDDGYATVFENKKTKRCPALIHGNGRTPMGHIYKLLP